LATWYTGASAGFWPHFKDGLIPPKQLNFGHIFGSGRRPFLCFHFQQLYQWSEIALIAHDNLLNITRRLYLGIPMGRDTPFRSNDIETDQRLAMCKVSTRHKNAQFLVSFCHPRRPIIGSSFARGPTMKSSTIKRSVVIDGRKTSLSLEEAFWRDLKEIADSKGLTLSNIVTMINKTKQQNNLSSAIRLFVFEQIKKRKSD
jgi:predicted DNA-binding ribbon-helix-helix protein